MRRRKEKVNDTRKREGERKIERGRSVKMERGRREAVREGGQGGGEGEAVSTV